MLRKEKNRIKKLFRYAEQQQWGSYRSSYEEDIELLLKQCEEYLVRIEEIRTDIEENAPQGYVGSNTFYIWRPARQALSQKQMQLKRVQLLIEKLVEGI